MAMFYSLEVGANNVFQGDKMFLVHGLICLVLWEVFLYVLYVELSVCEMKSHLMSFTVVKERDMITSIVKVPHLDFTVTSSQKGVLTIFNKKVILTQTCSTR